MYARRIEEEMSPAARAQAYRARQKRCASCGAEHDLSARECTECGYEFPAPREHLKACGNCSALNPVGAKECHACGQAFGHDFSLSLDEALRTGAIVRGMDIDEVEVQEAEAMAPKVRALVLRSGDHRLVKIVQTLPDESWARLRSILATD